MLDWPEDIRQLADALGLEKFAVAGHSGGGPYVCACAYSLPQRVTAGAIASGAGPADAPNVTRGMVFTNKLGITIGKYVPWGFWQILIYFFYHRRAEDPAADIDRHNGIRPKADDEQILQPEVRETCVKAEVEAFRPGLRGMGWDARLLTRPWGFPLEEIQVPVYIWHGTEDQDASLQMGKYVASQIPQSRMTICQGEGHLLLFPHWEEILSQIISPSPSIEEG